MGSWRSVKNVGLEARFCGLSEERRTTNSGGSAMRASWRSAGVRTQRLGFGCLQKGSRDKRQTGFNRSLMEPSRHGKPF